MSLFPTKLTCSNCYPSCNYYINLKEVWKPYLQNPSMPGFHMPCFCAALIGSSPRVNQMSFAIWENFLCWRVGFQFARKAIFLSLSLAADSDFLKSTEGQSTAGADPP